MIGISTLDVYAQPSAASAKIKASKTSVSAGNTAKTDENPAVLDFEGDVIEGQRKRPELFLQMETQDLTLDAILYLRNDFNDFHQVERNRKPGYYDKRAR